MALALFGDHGNMQHAAIVREGCERGAAVADEHTVPADDRIKCGLEGGALEVWQALIRGRFVPVANDEDYVVVVRRGVSLFGLAAALSRGPAGEPLRALRRFQDQRFVRLYDAGDE